MRPVPLALVLAAVYVLLAGAYLTVSSTWAARWTEDVESLARVELVKGLLFILATGLLFFGFSVIVFRRMQRGVDQMQRQQQALLVAERRSLSGVYAAMMAHDTNNVLSTVGIGLGVLSAAENLSEAHRAVIARMSNAVEGLLLSNQRILRFGRANLKPNPTTWDLAGTVGEVVEFARTHPKLEGRHIATNLPAGHSACLDRGQFELSLVNLLFNAGDAVGPGGHLRVSAGNDADHLFLSVEDDGPGVPPEMREKVFEAFESGKEGGLGLGLLSVKAFAEAHGGTVSVERSEWGGALFRISIPLSVCQPPAQKLTCAP